MGSRKGLRDRGHTCAEVQCEKLGRVEGNACIQRGAQDGCGEKEVKLMLQADPCSLYLILVWNRFTWQEMVGLESQGSR